ncbi:AraC family transcriptional regulator [Pontibacterium sp.]|jgi:AraC-like DNA-binding protein|uniref:AraC family transcriptional regulator n=1 Tax=Pontibacterium sp. TaxID=2036026 RepID=UPI0035632BAC
MSRFDRLSALISRFSLSVSPATSEGANLIVFCQPGNDLPNRVLLSPLKLMCGSEQEGYVPMFRACTDWGGQANPLLSALPSLIELDISDNAETGMLVQLLKAEGDAQRCGFGSVLNRLGEVLMVRLLRAQIEQGATEPGLLNGLSDARISRAIVAIHERPEKVWRNEDLAQIAGLSLSRFAELFVQIVGETPMAYLRRWRMVLARQDVERGERIQTVARRYGYGSGEALSRAFRRQFGESPLALRREAAADSQTV